MRRRSPLLAAALVTLAAAAAAPPARAAGLRAALVDGKTVKLDGVPKEWPDAMTRLGQAVQGQAQKPDLEAQALVSYDEAKIYVAADVTDDVLRAGGDRVELALGFPGGVVHQVALYPGDPGKTAGSVKIAGKPVAGAKIVEAPRGGGYTLEASIPWSAFPQAATVRVGLRAALFVHDADASTAAEAVVGSSGSSAYASLPALSTEPEQALSEGLLKSKGIRDAPAYNLIADVAGDALKERVLVFDRFLVVLGPGFRKGTEYYYNDMGLDPASMPLFQTKDLTGDGQSELVVRKRFGSGGRYREMMQVLRFGSSDTPQIVFQHEVALVTEKGSVQNDVSFVPDGGKLAIKVTPGQAKGFDANNYAEATETSFDPLLLPWGTIRSQLYKFDGGTFTKAKEETQPGTAAPPPPPAAAGPSAPAGPAGAQLLEQVYAQYKRDRGASGRPRFDITADVTGDREIERVLVHDRDIVVFGKGFKGGTAYTFLTMSQLASGADVKEITARDLTGDGKAELLVKGVMRAAAPKDVGTGQVEREVLLVFQIAGDVMRRVFAAETSRSMGSKKIAGELNLVSAGKGHVIDLAPGRATGWTEKSYPFPQDAGPVNGVEPLLLPWGGSTAARYKWNGSSFAR